MGGGEENTGGVKVATLNSNGQFSVLTYTRSNLGGGDLTEDSYGGSDYWLVISDTLLNIVSQKRYGGGRNDIGFSIISKGQDTYLCGKSNSLANGNKTTQNIGETDESDIWIIKTDKNGNNISQKSLGGGGRRGEIIPLWRE